MLGNLPDSEQNNEWIFSVLSKVFGCRSILHLHVVLVGKNFGKTFRLYS
jgi:uncharacterized protein YpbB